MKYRCQICNIIYNRPSLKIPGNNIAVRPANYYCNWHNVIYLMKCKKCDLGNYIGETSTFPRLRMNNHKKSIRDNNKWLPVTRHFNKLDHSSFDLDCVISNGDISNETGRLIDEQTLIRKVKTDTHGLNQDLDFPTPYKYFHKWYTSPSTHTHLTVDLHLRTHTALNNVLLLTGTLTIDAPLPPPTLPWRLTYIWEQWQLLLHFTTFLCWLQLTSCHWWRLQVWSKIMNIVCIPLD